ncbi:hypothetical protein N7540_002104 [Penicillium herquei]|nr:hypothetical protein N7540_002104 [Penicillium herquei]
MRVYLTGWRASQLRFDPQACVIHIGYHKLTISSIAIAIGFQHMSPKRKRFLTTKTEPGTELGEPLRYSAARSQPSRSSSPAIKLEPGTNDGLCTESTSEPSAKRRRTSPSTTSTFKASVDRQTQPPSESSRSTSPRYRPATSRQSHHLPPGSSARQTSSMPSTSAVGSSSSIPSTESPWSLKLVTSPTPSIRFRLVQKKPDVFLDIPLNTAVTAKKIFDTAYAFYQKASSPYVSRDAPLQCKISGANEARWVVNDEVIFKILCDDIKRVPLPVKGDLIVEVTPGSS